jgi:hypothetical protein
MSDLNELMSKGERDVTPLEACVRDMAFRGNGAAAELAAEQLARKDVEIAALRADNARLQAIEAAAREYWDHSCYVSDRDGNCIGCNGASEDPADHPDWCSFNVAGMKLIAALLDRKP